MTGFRDTNALSVTSPPDAVAAPAANNVAIDPSLAQPPPLTQEGHSLQALLELSQEIHATGDLYRVAELGLLKFMGHLGTAAAALWIISRQTGRPVLMRSFGIPERFATAIGEMCVPRIISRQKGGPAPVFVEDLQSALDNSETTLAQQARITLFGTLVSSGHPVGAIALGRRVTGTPYSSAQLRILEASLHHLGVAIENTLLYGNLLEQNRELRQARERLKELDALKQQFLNNLHHELRTPMGVILGYLDVMHEQITDRPGLSELLEGCRGQAERLHHLLETLLTFRDLSGERIVLQPVSRDLAPFVRAYYDERRPGVAKDLRELVLRCEPQEMPVVCDLERLSQILDELVENAVKFTPQGSRIELHLSAEHRCGRPWARLSIEDNGPGIPAHQLAEVFDSFRQLDGSPTRTVGGIGLGLTLSRELARRMGGDLEVSSEVGRGTTTCVLLPSV